MKLFAKNVLFLSLALLLLSIPIFAAGTTERVDKPEITVGSKIDTEGALLGNMIVLMLENDGFRVIDKTQTGSTPIVRSAIIAGEIDIYPEYTGNATTSSLERAKQSSGRISKLAIKRLLSST